MLEIKYIIKIGKSYLLRVVGIDTQRIPLLTPDKIYATQFVSLEIAEDKAKFIKDLGFEAEIIEIKKGKIEDDYGE